MKKTNDVVFNSVYEYFIELNISNLYYYSVYLITKNHWSSSFRILTLSKLDFEIINNFDLYIIEITLQIVMLILKNYKKMLIINLNPIILIMTLWIGLIMTLKLINLFQRMDFQIQILMKLKI